MYYYIVLPYTLLTFRQDPQKIRWRNTEDDRTNGSDTEARDSPWWRAAHPLVHLAPCNVPYLPRSLQYIVGWAGVRWRRKDLFSPRSCKGQSDERATRRATEQICQSVLTFIYVGDGGWWDYTYYSSVGYSPWISFYIGWLCPTFTKNFVGVSPILSNGTVGQIQPIKWFWWTVPQVKKLVDFVIKISEENNLIIISGLKNDGLHTNSLPSHYRKSNISVHTSHFAFV